MKDAAEVIAGPRLASRSFDPSHETGRQVERHVAVAAGEHGHGQLPIPLLRDIDNDPLEGEERAVARRRSDAFAGNTLGGGERGGAQCGRARMAPRLIGPDARGNGTTSARVRSGAGATGR
jgi:hypothetical protein